MDTDKLDMKSPDLVQENLEKIAALFPNCVTEGAEGKAIDFDLLKQELSPAVVEGNKERYRLEWPGKREAIVTANLPTTKTLRPVREDSVDFDNTENLYIEGDNLEVLKLLQESYLGKIKMIYIDPPYNTGKDFVYKDNFTMDKGEWSIVNGNKDEYNQRLVANPETAGRYHSDWLSMMYPRLKLARNLLTKSGVIFISIDDNEYHNLKKLCDDVYGERNFVGNIIWKNVTDNNPSNIATEHEYILVCAKDKPNLETFWKSRLSDVKELLIKKGEEMISSFDDSDERQRKYTQWFRNHKSELWPLENYKFIDEQGVYSGERGVHNPGKEGYRYDIIHPETLKPCKEPLMGYRFPKETMYQMIKEGRIIFGKDEDKLVEIKVYAKEYKQKLSSVFNLDGRTGANELKALFTENKKVFTNPKTIKLLSELFAFVTRQDDIILDFYSGSSSSAHALLDLNAKDGAKRRFILVQLPEEIDETKEAYKAGYKTICEIGKERIRRAAQSIVNGQLSVLNEKKEDVQKGINGQLLMDNGQWKFPEGVLVYEEAKTLLEEVNHLQLKINNLDTGFRVYRLDSSNMQDVYYRPQDYDQNNLELFADNIKSDRTADDLLAQVMLDWGLPLSLKIEQVEVSGKKVFKVAENSLYACFDRGIDEDFAKAIAQDEPLRIVFRDSGFKNDTAKTNVKQLLKQLSPETEMKVI
ncbi:MAG: site-specific DNA-methyltransferase [Bacteroidota bacterium]